MDRTIARLLDRQDGIIARYQVLGAGLEPHEIRRRLRRRDWVQVHRGVYVAHTGALTWRQRAWAAVLWAWPSALWGPSALEALEGSGEVGGHRPVIHLAVARHRSGLRSPSGVVVHHVEHLDPRTQWNATPPRSRIEDAVLDSASLVASDVDAIAVLALWIQRRRTTPRRLLDALSRRSRVARRSWLTVVLEDLAEGTCSALEHGYLTKVERPHRLPRGVRQRPDRSSQGVVYRDADYGRVLVELDGRMFHDSAQARDRDLERDLDAAVDRRGSIRLGWGQVFDRPCATAAKLATVMRLHGLDVRPRSCGPDCPVV